MLGADAGSMKHAAEQTRSTSCSPLDYFSLSDRLFLFEKKDHLVLAEGLGILKIQIQIKQFLLPCTRKNHLGSSKMPSPVSHPQIDKFRQGLEMQSFNKHVTPREFNTCMVQVTVGNCLVPLLKRQRECEQMLLPLNITLEVK